MRASIGAAALGAFLAFGSLVTVGNEAAAAPVIVNITSTTFAPVDIALSAGTYQITPIGPGGGGLFSGWNAWGIVSLCDGNGANCDTGYLWDMRFGAAATFPTIGTNVGAAGIFATGAMALANAQTSLINSTFVLAADETIRFAIMDSHYIDNIGGVSFSLDVMTAEVPAPAALVLLGFGLFAAGAIRRNKN